MVLSCSWRLMKTGIFLAVSPRLEGWRGRRHGQSSSLEQNPMEFKFTAETQRWRWGTRHADLQSPSLGAPGLWLVAGPQAAFGGSHIQGDLVVGPHNRPLAGPSVWRLKTSWPALTDARHVLGVPLHGLPALSGGLSGLLSGSQPSPLVGRQSPVSPPPSPLAAVALAPRSPGRSVLDVVPLITLGKQALTLTGDYCLVTESGLQARGRLSSGQASRGRAPESS